MAPDSRRFRSKSRQPRIKPLGGTPPSALLTRSKSWYAVASWRDHTTLGKLVVLAGWLGTLALMAGGVLALARGVEARETLTVILASTVLAGGALCGLAAWGFTRFRPWAWRLAAGLYLILTVAGVLVVALGGDVRGAAPASLGVIMLLALRLLSDGYFPPPES